MKKAFSFAAVMSVVTFRSLQLNLQEQYDLLGHLVGEPELQQVDIDRDLYLRAQAVLFRQFPVLGDGKMQFAFGRLILMLEETEAGKTNRKELILGWLSEQALRLGWDLNSPVMVEGV